MYSYTFLLTPSRNKSDIIFTEYKEIFLEAIDNINGGLAFKRDNKITLNFRSRNQRKRIKNHSFL